jgi:hypothetical protein
MKSYPNGQMTLMQLLFWYALIGIAYFISKFIGKLLGLNLYFFILPVLIIEFLFFRWLIRRFDK